MLGGEHYGHITLNNLRMFLLAIKGLHVMPDVKFTENPSQYFKLSDIPPDSTEQTMDAQFTYLGLFSQQGDMYLFEEDVEKAARMFKDMINCRLLHEQKQLLKRKGERSLEVLYEFRPYVSEKST